jgi:Mg-chelatase subunit ChlD
LNSALSESLSSAAIAWHFVLYDRAAPRAVALRRERTSVGRHPDCDIVLADPSVSERHAVLQTTPEGLEIFDLASAESTFVNERRVEADLLRAGDRVRFGRIVALVVDPGADALPSGVQLLFPPPRAATTRLAARTPRDLGKRATDAARRLPIVVISIALHVLVYVASLLLAAPAQRHSDPASISVQFVTLSDRDVAGATVPELAEKDDVGAIAEEPMPEPPAGPESLDALGDAQVDATVDAPLGPGGEEGFGDARPNVIAIGGGGGLGPGVGFGSGSTGGSPFGGTPFGSGKGLPGGKLGSSIQSLRASGLDIVVLIDATGSMDAQIEAARKKTGDMIALLDSLEIAFRLGIVAFRDKGDDYVVRSEPLTPYRFKAMSFLDTISAGGGGDEPEAVYDALAAAVGMSWSPKAKRVIVLVGDAPPHAVDVQKTLALARRFADSRGQVHTIVAEAAVGRALDSSAPAVFARLADAGGGTALSLADQSQLVTNIMCLAFEAQSPREVETLMKDSLQGWHSRMVRDRLRRGDCEFVVKQLSSVRMNAVVPRELLQESSDLLIPAYVDTLLDMKAPLAHRWLATLLLRRILAQGERPALLPREARIAWREFSPEAPAGKQKRLLKTLTEGLMSMKLLDPIATEKKLRAAK